MRVRKEIRSLSTTEWNRVVKAMRIMKTTSLHQGQLQYGSHFITYDFMTLKHAHAALSIEGDQAHNHPVFALFHRAWLYQFENALIAVDPLIEGIPYWDSTIDQELFSQTGYPTVSTTSAISEIIRADTGVAVSGTIKITTTNKIEIMNSNMNIRKTYSPITNDIHMKATDDTTATNTDSNKTLTSIFSDEYLGAYIGQGENYEIHDGKFAYWKIAYNGSSDIYSGSSGNSDDDDNNYSSSDNTNNNKFDVFTKSTIPTNIYGYFRHPLSLNPSPYLSRKGGSICGISIGLPTKQSWDYCLLTSSSSGKIFDWMNCAGPRLHNPPHASVAGTWRRPGQTTDSNSCVSWYGTGSPPSTIDTNKISAGTAINAYTAGCFVCPDKIQKYVSRNSISASVKKGVSALATAADEKTDTSAKNYKIPDSSKSKFSSVFDTSTTSDDDYFYYYYDHTTSSPSTLSPSSKPTTVAVVTKDTASTTASAALESLHMCRPIHSKCGPLFTGFITYLNNHSISSSSSGSIDSGGIGSDSDSSNDSSLETSTTATTTATTSISIDDFKSVLANASDIQIMGDFGDTSFSPNDPIFLFHHANIDRHFSTWVLLQWFSFISKNSTSTYSDATSDATTTATTIDSTTNKKYALFQQTQYFHFPVTGYAYGCNLNDVISHTDPFMNLLQSSDMSSEWNESEWKNKPYTVKDIFDLMVATTFDDQLYTYDSIIADINLNPHHQQRYDHSQQQPSTNNVISNIVNTITISSTISIPSSTDTHLSHLANTNNKINKNTNKLSSSLSSSSLSSSSSSSSYTVLNCHENTNNLHCQHFNLNILLSIILVIILIVLYKVTSSKRV